jgi:hypothetical protein
MNIVHTWRHTRKRLLMEKSRFARGKCEVMPGKNKRGRQKMMMRIGGVTTVTRRAATATKEV